MSGSTCVADVELPNEIKLVSSKNHRITELFGLERTFRGHLAQPPCSEQGHLQPDQVAQKPYKLCGR